MTGAAGLIVMVRVLVPVPPALVALKATLTVAEETGVPEIRPVAVLTDKPPGSPVAVKVVGRVRGEIWEVEGTLKKPEAGPRLGMTGAAGVIVIVRGFVAGPPALGGLKGTLKVA